MIKYYKSYRTLRKHYHSLQHKSEYLTPKVYLISGVCEISQNVLQNVHTMMSPHPKADSPLTINGRLTQPLVYLLLLKIIYIPTFDIEFKKSLRIAKYGGILIIYSISV